MPSGKTQEQNLIKQAQFEAIRAGVEYGKLENTLKAFSFKCLKINDIVFEVSSASPGWGERYTTLDKKMSSPLRRFALCNQLP